MRGLARYRTQRVQTAGPERVLIMLLDTAHLKLEVAADAQRQGDRAIEELGHARAILLELLAALDDDAAPELTTDLRALYQWMIRELIGTSRVPDADRVDGVRRVLVTLRDGFNQAAEAA